MQVSFTFCFLFFEIELWKDLGNLIKIWPLQNRCQPPIILYSLIGMYQETNQIWVWIYWFKAWIHSTLEWHHITLAWPILTRSSAAQTNKDKFNQVRAYCSAWHWVAVKISANPVTFSPKIERDVLKPLDMMHFCLFILQNGMRIHHVLPL